MKHIALIPLIGGFPLAAEEVLGTPPQRVMSYAPFYGNDKLYTDYKGLIWEDITLARPTYADLCYGTPPCNGLSTASCKINKTTGETNVWMIKLAKYALEQIQPKVYVFENAPGLWGDNGKIVRGELTKVAQKNGYAVTFFHTNSKKHGLPQSRKRTYTIFVKGDRAVQLPKFDKPMEKLADYLTRKPKGLYDDVFVNDPYLNNWDTVKFLKTKYGDSWRLKVLGDYNHRTIFNHLIMKDWLEEMIAFTDNTKLIRLLRHIKVKVADGKGYWHKLNNSMICTDHVNAVFSGNFGLFSHPTEDRILSIGELSWLMGLPQDMVIDDFQKLGQNVPVATTKDIIRECIKVINGEANFADCTMIMQKN